MTTFTPEQNAMIPNVGPSTLGVKASGPNTVQGSNTLPKGMGSQVGKNITSTPTSSIQSKLGISADGQYGPQTTDSVKKFQSANGLTADGIVGPKTLAKLMGDSSQSGSSTSQAPAQSPSQATSVSPSTSLPALAQSTAQMKPSAPNGADVPYTNNNGLYGQLVTGLANQGGSKYNETIQNSANSLQDISKSNPGTSGPAYNDYQQSIQELNDLKANIAKQTGGIESQPISMQFQQGKEQALARQNAALLEAAQAKVNEKAAALGYGIQGTQVQQTGFNQAGNLGISGQNLNQSAVNQAAGYSAPQLGSIGQVPFNPISQGQGNILGSQGGGLNQAASLLGSFQGAQSTASNQYQQVEEYKSAHQQAMNLQSQLTDLIQTFGLNPNDINVANIGIQKIAQNTSSPQYKILANYLADVASRYSQILTPAGGSSTDTTRAVATSMLDGVASGQSIIQVMNALDQQAQAVISGVGTNNTGTAPSNSNAPGGFGWNG